MGSVLAGACSSLLPSIIYHKWVLVGNAWVSYLNNVDLIFSFHNIVRVMAKPRNSKFQKKIK